MNRRDFLKMSAATCVANAACFQSELAISDDTTINPKTFLFQSPEASIMTAIYDHDWQFSERFLSDLESSLPCRGDFYEFGFRNFEGKTGPATFQSAFVNMLFVAIRDFATSLEIQSALTLCRDSSNNGAMIVLVTENPDGQPKQQDVLMQAVDCVFRLPTLDAQNRCEPTYQALLWGLSAMFTATTTRSLMNIDPVELQGRLSEMRDGQIGVGSASGHARALVAANAVLSQVKNLQAARSIFVTIMVRDGLSEEFHFGEYRQIMETLQPEPGIATARHVGIIVNPDMADSVAISCVALA